MHLVLGLLFIGHELVAGWDRHVDSHAEWIAGALLLVRMLDRDVAAADVIAKTIEPRCLAPDQVVDLSGFFDTAIGDFKR